MIVVGIDPGISGAIAIYDGHELVIHPMPILGGYVDISTLQTIIPSQCTVMIEEIAPRPGNTMSGAVKSAINWGLIVGQLKTRGIPVLTVKPSAWKKAMALKAPDKSSLRERKELAVKKAEEIFPTNEFRTVKGALRDGHAEASLLAWHLFTMRRGTMEVA